jgi:AbrB family looped-hinge helix DNA binding protein
MKISERGQITIPKQYRKRYGLNRDVEVEIIPQEGGILIKKRAAKRHPVEEFFGVLNRNIETDSYIEEIRGR